MIVFLLPFAVVIGALVFAGRKSEPAHLQIAGAAPPPRYTSTAPLSSPSPPSPIAVLSDFVRANAAPPAIVVQCAIAQAELMGRSDLALALTREYVIPALARGRGGLQGGGGEGDGEPAPAAQPSQAQIPSPMTPASPPAAAGPPVYTSSPIRGVPDAAWQAFCGALVRESPDFDGPRHIGRYRHRKDRLAEIGFDPAAVAGAPHVQDDAFAADVADSFRHLLESGTLDQVIGQSVPVPEVGKVPITLSGMLGLSSVAGLEGAIEWLQRPDDRTRYPHTTQAFLRCNGVF